MVRETSIKSYKEIIEEGILGVRQAQVFRAIHRYPESSDRVIALITHLPINQVTGRRNELMDEGCVVDAGVVLDDETGKSVHIWKVPDIIVYHTKPKKARQKKLTVFGAA